MKVFFSQGGREAGPLKQNAFCYANVYPGGGR